MVAISSVSSAYSRDDAWRARAQSAAQDFGAAIVQTRAQAATAGYTGGAGSLVTPSLLVAVQESDMVRDSGQSEAGGSGFFAHAEEDENAQLLDEILEKGLAGWAHDKWIDRMREKARQTALADMGMTEADLAALTPEMQEQMERLIAERVEEAIRTAVEEASEKNSEQAMVVSPIVTGG